MADTKQRKVDWGKLARKFRDGEPIEDALRRLIEPLVKAAIKARICKVGCGCCQSELADALDALPKVGG